MKSILVAVLSSSIFIVLSFSLSGFRQEENSVASPQEAASLGEKLFFDAILSKDRSVSCASCHKREFAFADNVPFSSGIDGKPTKRNAPSAMN
ncbi:MAG: cytochrome c peroxidase, partial [Cytophagales bacterium]